ncbi:unnamed protein product [Closterium sp. Naga37s-1]|nr:unnamed protein product [Closterium sp. Naga37s-1]CAI5517963.1 unnamed protein product [Closterium sp. Naga37s-1]
MGGTAPSGGRLGGTQGGGERVGGTAHISAPYYCGRGEGGLEEAGGGGVGGWDKREGGGYGEKHKYRVTAAVAGSFGLTTTPPLPPPATICSPFPSPPFPSRHHLLPLSIPPFLRLA